MLKCMLAVCSLVCSFQWVVSCLFAGHMSDALLDVLGRLNAIPVLADALKGSGKEKVTRIILAALRVRN